MPLWNKIEFLAYSNLSQFQTIAIYWVSYVTQMSINFHISFQIVFLSNKNAYKYLPCRLNLITWIGFCIELKWKYYVFICVWCSFIRILFTYSRTFFSPFLSFPAGNSFEDGQIEAISHCILFYLYTFSNSPNECFHEDKEERFRA